jgi:hemerythrin-like domain-containing protein
MLERSHRRLEERLSELQQAATAIVRERAGVAELSTVDSVVAFLEKSAARHEADEEESFFPRLRRVRDLTPLLDDLLAEHVLHRHLINQLRSLRSRWPVAGPGASDGAALVTLANELARLYRAHIEREERELLPAANAHLGPDEREAIQAEMDRRRSAGDGHGRNGGGHGGGRRRMPAGSSGPRIREV